MHFMQVFLKLLYYILSYMFSEAGKAPSRAGACRVCLKALKPGEVFHICNGCQHRVCEDCSSYSKPASDEEAVIMIAINRNFKTRISYI